MEDRKDVPKENTQADDEKNQLLLSQRPHKLLTFGLKQRRCQHQRSVVTQKEIEVKPVVTPVEVSPKKKRFQWFKSLWLKQKPVPAIKPIEQKPVIQEKSEVVINEGKYKFGKIKILDQSMIKVVNDEDFRYLHENFLNVELRTLQMMDRRKYGVACKFQVNGEEIKVGDFMQFSGFRYLKFRATANHGCPV